MIWIDGGSPSDFSGDDGGRGSGPGFVGDDGGSGSCFNGDVPKTGGMLGSVSGWSLVH